MIVVGSPELVKNVDFVVENGPDFVLKLFEFVLKMFDLY